MSFIQSNNIKTLEDWKKYILGAGSGRAIYETEANIFAECVLMPKDKLLTEYEKARQKAIDQFKSLKMPVPKHAKIIPYVANEIAKIFEVSSQAAEIRLKNVIKD